MKFHIEETTHFSSVYIVEGLHYINTTKLEGHYLR
jgi:hypothetical protein